MQAVQDSLNAKIWSQHLEVTVPEENESDLYQGYVESENTHRHTKRKEELKKIARGELAGTPRAGKREESREKGDDS